MHIIHPITGGEKTRILNNRLKLTTETNVGLGDAVHLSQFSSLRNGSGYRKLPDGTIKMWGIAITTNMSAGAGGTWSVSLPTAFPNAMLSATASLAMGAAGGGVFVSVMDVGTPFTGTTDTKLPATKQTTISGSVFNGMKWSTKTGHRVRVFPVSIF